MKGFKDSNNKFHPITDYKGVRKSRDQSAKTQGIRLKRKGQLFKPQESRNVMVGKNEVIIWDDDGVEVAIWVREEWEEDSSAIPAIRNAIRLANQGKVEEIKKMIDFDKFHPIQEKTRPRHLDRKARVSKLKILQPMIKGKLDSVFYDGEIATMTAKDGIRFDLTAVGDVGLFIDDNWFTDIDDAERGGYKLNDKKISQLDNDGRLKWSNNNWFEVTIFNPKTKQWSDNQPDAIEDYDSAIEQLKEDVKDYEKGDLEF